MHVVHACTIRYYSAYHSVTVYVCVCVCVSYRNALLTIQTLNCSIGTQLAKTWTSTFKHYSVKDSGARSVSQVFLRRRILHKK